MRLLKIIGFLSWNSLLGIITLRNGKKVTLSEWRVDVVDGFLMQEECASFFRVPMLGSKTKAERIAKKSVFKKDEKWFLDVKHLMNMESLDEVLAFKKMVCIIEDELPLSENNSILFTNEYDSSGRIYLGVLPRIRKSDSNYQFLSINKLADVLEKDLFDWQKRFAKDLRCFGRYSFFNIDASALYGRSVVYKLIKEKLEREEEKV